VVGAKGWPWGNGTARKAPVLSELVNIWTVRRPLPVSRTAVEVLLFLANSAT
jgi:hypothetical protein